MRKIRDVLRLELVAVVSIRQIKAGTKVRVDAILKLLAKAEEERPGNEVLHIRGCPEPVCLP